MKLLSAISLFIFLAFNSFSQNCGVIYVTPAGNGSGSSIDPSSLENALSLANPNDIIRLAIGTYSIDNPLNLVSDVTLEGGFNPSNGWSKTSLAGATTINRTTLNPEGPTNGTRLVAFYGNSISNFRLQDLTITTENAILNGGSTYAVHLNNCSDYTIARCQLLAGDAGSGSNGSNGINGSNGSFGISGQLGNNDDESFGGGGGNGGNGGGASNAGAGGAGGTTSANNGLSGGSPSGIFGGGGGGGASGGGEDRDGGTGGNGGGPLGAGGSAGQESGCNSGINCGSSESGNDGANGANGNNGIIGANGPSGAHIGGFWVPGAIAGTGTNGTGGAGGGGGGGGAGEGGFFCVDGKGSGGGGGQAGTGATGGTGGGASYGLYLVNNGTNGVVLQSLLTAGNQGAGGQGGNGGIGGNGGFGGNGSTYTGGEVGCGGDGGNGGRGGDGGNGGNGASGEALDVYLNSGDPLTTNDNTFNLVAQPEIIKDSVTCMNQTIQFETPSLPSGVPGAGVGVANWDFDVYSNVANPASGLNNPDTTMYTTAGRYSISQGANTYEGFVYVSPEQTIEAGADQQLCDVVTGTLVGTTSGTNVIWTSLGAATINNPTNISTDVQNLQPGENKFVLTAGDCCPADPDTISIIVGTANTATDVQSACDTYDWIDGNTYTSNNNSSTFTLTNASGCDSLVTLDLTINAGTTATDVVSACDSYTWIDGNTYTADNNIATFTLTNAVGCDSVVTLNLTLDGISNSGTDAQVACDSYQWIDGNTYTANNNTATFTLTNQAGCDSLVTLDLELNQSSTGIDDIYACNDFTWIDGNNYTSSNNTATYTLTNSVGCDSIVTLDLIVNNPDINITNNAPTLTATASSGSFQWVSCDENYTPIAGETNATYTAIGNGSYAVIVTQNGCTDTSACETIANIGLESLSQESINIFPNPTNGLVKISNTSIIQSIKVFDATGRIIIDKDPQAKEVSIDLSKYSKGTYTMEITLNEGVIRRKVIKQ